MFMIVNKQKIKKIVTIKLKYNDNDIHHNQFQYILNIRILNFLKYHVK